ncbi:MEDS domain-containing protein [Kibdelosporangium philippinense]
MSRPEDESPRTVPVQRLRPGDHSFVAFTDVEARWQVLTAYTRTGLARREKVLLVLDPSDLSDDDAVARMDGAGNYVEAARASGQLVITRSTSLYLPDGRFDKDRQLAVAAPIIEDVQREGWHGLRAASDMTWALRPGVDLDEVIDFEVSIGPIVTIPGVTGICWYDRRRFSSYWVAAAREVHPVQVMERLDAVSITRTPSGWRIAGSAESSSREEFTEALSAALKQPDTGSPFHFELDMTDLCFMEAHCAWQLISLAAALPESSKVVVHCGPLLDLVLRGLGSDTVSQLELNVAEEP